MNSNKKDTNNKNNGDDEEEDEPIHPIFYYTTTFLLLTTLLQIITSYHNTTGPIDWFAGLLIPQLATMGIMTGNKIHFNEDEVGIDGKICPPDDKWIDSAFDQTFMNNNNNNDNSKLYSSENDPRLKLTRPSLFPHCSLNRWVHWEEGMSSCPSGQEYVTVIHPPRRRRMMKQSSADNNNSQDDNNNNNKIPHIIHVSSPTNCLPKSTLQTFQRLLTQYNEYTIYIHSSMAMDNFLYQREWDIFPEMKEGLLCGMGKLRAASLAAIHELLPNVNVVVGNNDNNNNNSTKEQIKEQIANEISMGVKRDIWRYMILWEYGGIATDIETIHAILSPSSKEEEGTIPATNLVNSTSTTSSTNDGGYNTLKKLIHQWYTENNDAILYFINNVEKQRLPFVERIPLTDIMGAVPNHPLIYYSAKSALRIAIWDNEVR